MIDTIINVVLGTVAVAGVALPLWYERDNLGWAWSVYRSVTWRLWLKAVGVVFVTLVVITLLWQVPVLSWGWYMLLTGQSGNAIITPVSSLSSSPNWGLRFLVILFIFALTMVLPFLARSEERSFRAGVVDHWPIVRKSIKFGLCHCLVGVPIAAGLALIISGLFYGYTYRNAYLRSTNSEAALDASIAAHTAYNAIVVTILAVACALMMSA